jgi:hypothetical protein
MSDELTFFLIAYVLVITIAIYFISKNENLKEKIMKWF